MLPFFQFRNIAKTKGPKSSFKKSKVINDRSSKCLGITFIQQQQDQHGMNTTMRFISTSNSSSMAAKTTLNTSKAMPIFCSPTQERRKEFKALMKLDAVITWRSDPNPQRLVDMWVTAANNNVALTVHGILMDATTIQVVFSQKPFAPSLNQVVQQLLTKVHDKRRLVGVSIGLWMLNTKESRDLLQQISKLPGVYTPFHIESHSQQFKLSKGNLKEEIDHMNNTQPPWKNIKELVIKEAATLDYLWVHYFLTGDRSSVTRIIESMGPVLNHEELKAVMQLEHPTTDKRMVGHAATSSVQTNANQYPEVLRICEEAISLPNLPPVIKETLLAAVSLVHSKNELSVPVDTTYRFPKYGEIVLKGKIDAVWKRGQEYPVQLEPEEYQQTATLIRTLIRFILADQTFKKNSSLIKHIEAAKVFISAYNLDLPEALELDHKGSLKEIRAQYYLKAALKIAPEDIFVNKLIGVFLTQTGDQVGGLHYLERALELGDKTVLYSIAKIYVGNDHEEALKYLEEYTSYYPADEKAQDFMNLLKTSPGSIKSPFSTLGLDPAIYQP